MDPDPSDRSSTLPVVQPEPLSGTEAAVSKVALVCDDVASITNFVTKVAGRLGVTCHEAGTAEAIQELALVHRSALMFLDLSLGRGDAIQVLKFLMEHDFAGPIVLISGHEPAVLDNVAAIGRRHGLTMREPLRKPVTADAIRKVLYAEGLATSSSPKRPLHPAGAAVRQPRSESPPARPPAIREPDSLKDVFGRDQLELWYRPTVDLSDYRATGVETRARFVGHGSAQDLGAMMDRLSADETTILTRSLVAQARADWEALAEKGLNLRFCLNVPTSEVLSGRLCEAVRKYWTKDPRWPGLVIEIKEDCLDGDFETLRDELIRLRLYKVDFAVNDLGRVSSRYQAYKRLRVGELKLNRAFVHGCAEDTYKAAICEASVELGRKLGVPVTAKGIEGASDLALVRSQGFAHAQGDFLSPALPFDNLAALLGPGTPLYRPRASAT